MSRTDKDRPYWVRVLDPEEDRRIYHNHRNLGKVVLRITSTSGTRVLMYAEECTLDEVEERFPGNPETVKPCGYGLNDYRRHRWDRLTTEDRRNTYFKPLRRLEKNVLTNVVKEYNTHGDIEKDIVLPDQHQKEMLGGGWFN